MTSSTQMTEATLRSSLEVIEVKKGVRFSVQMLRTWLPDVETLLFFAKVYDLDAKQLGHLLHKVLATDLTAALFGEGGEHSVDLQDYLVDLLSGVPDADAGDLNFGQTAPMGEILPAVWESLEIEVARSIKAVAEKLESVVDMLPGKQGEMVFRSMMTMNAKRPTIGDHRAVIHHAPQKENLLILDVSGSVTLGTVRRIIDDVVALSYKANAHMAIVSNDTVYWQPGSYSVDDVMARVVSGGTHYETLHSLFDRDWGTVICVADYDSSQSAKQYLRDTCVGRIDTVLDVSLVNRPTFLAECVGQLADEVRPILIANSPHVLSA